MSKEVMVVEDGEVVELDNVVKLSKKYTFEGTEYDKVDLSGLNDITAMDMIDAEKNFNRAGGFSVMPELTLEYALIIASKASKHPIEFYYGLNPVDARRVKNTVSSFFFGQD